MEILLFDAVASEITGEAYAAAWLVVDVFSGLEGGYLTDYIDDPANLGILVNEGNIPDKNWIKDNIVPSWGNTKVVKSGKKMRQEFWNILEYFQPQQIWTDAAFPIKSHFLWQAVQENFDQEKSIVLPFPIFELANYADEKIERINILREAVAESSGGATGFIELCGQKLLLKPNNPLVSCMASMTLFTYLLSREKIIPLL